MNRLIVAIAAATMLAGASPVLADQCSQLSGARWSFYLEGPFAGTPTIASALVDFRKGIAKAPMIATLQTTPLAVANSQIKNGDSYLQQVTSCTVENGSAHLFVNNGGGLFFTVSADGSRAQVRGADANDGRMIGWAMRLPS